MQRLRLISALDDFYGSCCVSVLCPTNSHGHMESGPRFKVSSERLDEPGFEPRPLVYKASTTRMLQRHLVDRSVNISACGYLKKMLFILGFVH